MNDAPEIAAMRLHVIVVSDNEVGFEGEQKLLNSFEMEAFLRAITGCPLSQQPQGSSVAATLRIEPRLLERGFNGPVGGNPTRGTLIAPGELQKISRLERRVLTPSQELTICCKAAAARPVSSNAEQHVHGRQQGEKLKGRRLRLVFGQSKEQLVRADS